MLCRRIKALEDEVRRRTPPPDEPEPALDPLDFDRFLSGINANGYRTWRHEGLSLEELLALARDDVRYAEAHAPAPAPPYSWLGEDRGAAAAKHAAVAAREFEIRILERDHRFDADAARALRANTHEVVAGRAALAPLPTQIAYDEAASLASARKRVPRRSTLPLARQLEMENEDHAHELEERDRRGRKGLLDPSLDAVDDRMHDMRVAELQERMARTERA